MLLSPYRPNPTVRELAEARGVDPVELMIDVALEHDLDLFFMQFFGDERDDEMIATLRNPNTAMTFSDSGAHVSQIIDSSIQTYLLAHWVREREAFTLEEAVRMITSRPAAVWGLHDRGVLARGRDRRHHDLRSRRPWARACPRSPTTSPAARAASSSGPRASTASW